MGPGKDDGQSRGTRVWPEGSRACNRQLCSALVACNRQLCSALVAWVWYDLQDILGPSAQGPEAHGVVYIYQGFSVGTSQESWENSILDIRVVLHGYFLHEYM